MFFAIWAILIFLAMGALVKNSRRVLYDDFSTNTNIDEFSVQMGRLARTMTLPSSHGKGVETAAAEKYVNRAYRLIKRRIIKGDELYEFEKWLYDNHYILKRIFQHKETSKFFDLPHAGTFPRIVLLARGLVSLTGGNVTKERINVALSAVNKVAPLTYKEMENFEAAVNFAIVEKLASVSKKCIYYRKMLRVAVRAKNVVKKYAQNNLYIYYTVKKNPVISEKLKGFLDEKAVKYDNIDYTFSALIVENNVLTSALVTSLMHVRENSTEKFNLLPVVNALKENETYKNSDIATKKSILSKISALSDDINLDEAEYAKRLLALAESRKTDFSVLLFNGGKSLQKSVKENANVISDKSKYDAQSVYVFLNVLFTILLSVAAGGASLALGAGLAVSILGVIGALAPAFFFSNKVCALFLEEKQVCRLNYSDVPDYAKTEVIVPVFISNEISLRENLAHISQIAKGNPFNNLRFTLLIDFASSDKETDEKDRTLMDILKNELPENVGVALRKRKKIGNSFCGYERKRGAVMNYAEYLMTGNDENFRFLSAEYARPEFFAVLDADSELAPQSIMSAINAFLHPMNEGYDLLSFECKTNLFSVNTFYTKKFIQNGGMSKYPEYGNFYYKLCGQAAFCGKGIFRLSSYYQKLNNRLPENKILSHDLIEGALVDTGSAGIEVYEDVPASFSADEDRRLRWTRGDVQLLPYINLPKNVENGDKMPLSFRYLMYFNAFSVFFEPYVLTLLLISLFLNLPYLAVFAAAIFSLEFVYNVLAGLFGIFTGRRMRYCLSEIAYLFYTFILSVITLPYKAIINFLVFTATVFRMTVTKKGLLNWKTFADCNKKKQKKMSLPEKTISTIKNYASSTYKFFDVASSADGLIADHFTVIPKNRPSDYTSPTNLGFAILAEASAYLLNLKSREDAENRATEIIDASLKLKKWNGHLYNWYGLSDKKPLHPFFVSSVDSGNFIASLLTVAGVFGGSIKKTVDDYIKTVDFKSLFDESANMFYIGYNEAAKRYEGHYDNLVSEARLLNYLGVCFGLPVSLWDGLSRDYTSLRGNTLLSWGGTAFEYLMPDLFLSTPKYGLLHRTSKNAAKIMRSTKCNGLFGISEGGYFGFDKNGNFLYKAFGVDSLGLKSEINRCVITPYSSFLMLPYVKYAVIKNLKKLENKEAFGDYGFYEAADFTRAPRLVTEYMAHHQGMIMCATANYLSNNGLIKAFESNVAVASARILLTEKQYEGKAFKPEKNKFIYEEKFNAEIVTECCKNSAVPQFDIIKNGDYTVVIDDFGCGYSAFKGIDINRFRRDISKFYGAFFYVVDEDGKVSSPCRAPLNNEADYKVTFKKSCAEFSNFSTGLSQTVYAPAFFNGEYRKLKIVNDGDVKKKYKVAFFSELCLNYRDADVSHRTYSNMFVETEVKDGVLYANRRSKEKDKGIYGAMYVSGVKPRYVSNRYNFLGRKNSVKKPDCVFYDIKAKSDDNGTVLDPCFAFTAFVEIDAHGSVEIEVYTAVSTSVAGLEADIRRAKNPHFSELVKKIPYVAENNEGYDLDSRFTAFLSKIIAPLLYTPYSGEVLYNACNNHKLFTEITDNFYRKTLLLKYSGSRSELKQCNAVCKILNEAGIPTSLVVWYKETDGYFAPVHAEIMKTVQGIVGKNVHLIESARIDFDILTGICFRDFSKFDEDFTAVYNPEIGNLIPFETDDEIYYVSGEGGFSEKGYKVKPFERETLLPYSNVICGEVGGIITGDGGGYTYYGNSRESKLTVWENDFTENSPSERLTLFEGEKGIDLLSGSQIHALGKTTYYGSTEKYLAKTQVYIIRSGGAKIYEVQITSRCNLSGSLILNLNLALGAERNVDYVFYKIEDGVYEAVNLKNGVSCYLATDGGQFITDFYPYSRGGKAFSSALGNIAYGAEYKVDLEKGENKKFYFIFGGDFQAVSEGLCEISDEKAMSIRYFNNINPFRIESDDKALNILFNDCLSYQVISSRINGRTSLYQAGGAIGFRDILQDALTLIYTDAERARKIILEVADHTYVEGDVMHWWHGEKHGVRTRISDDKLFLPYVATEYARATGDNEIFECETKYLNSSPLSATEDARYENPPYHEKTDTLLLHMERIMESSYRTGENGLLLIGGGDWNDALNAVGTSTAGESVWLSEMYIVTAEKICELYQGKEKLLWLDRISRLKSAVEKTFTGKQFKRLLTAGGEWLGDGYNKELSIDIITQAWAEFANVGDKKYREIALNSAKNILIDKNNGSILLLAPPLTGKKYYGYISLYPQGIRENGGQYTHGAIWFLMALIKQGRVDEAYEAFSMINPVNKCANPKNVFSYMGEPYVLSADVYHNLQHDGRAGWSWYTGSASWCYKLILEGFLGIKLINGNLEVKPNLPAKLNEVKIEYHYKNSIYKIKAVRCGRKAVIENGIETGNDLIIPLVENDNRTFTVYF